MPGSHRPPCIVAQGTVPFASRLASRVGGLDDLDVRGFQASSAIAGGRRRRSQDEDRRVRRRPLDPPPRGGGQGGGERCRRDAKAGMESTGRGPPGRGHPHPALPHKLDTEGARAGGDAAEALRDCSPTARWPIVCSRFGAAAWPAPQGCSLRSRTRPLKLGVITGSTGTMRFRGPGLVRVPEVAFVSGIASLTVASPPRSPTSRRTWPGRVLERRNTLRAGQEATRILPGRGPTGLDDRPIPADRPRRFGPDRAIDLDPSGTLDGGDVLPGFVLPLGELFAELDHGKA